MIAVRRLISFAVLLALGAAAPAVPEPAGRKAKRGSDPAKEITDPAKLPIVDCALPPRIRRLGRMRTYTAPQPPIRTTGLECEIRGGDYVAYDRANLTTALAVFLGPAEEGDAEAQNYVGEIYERGLGLPPNHETAASWYLKAAEQGYARAQINYGNLLEKGLGVAENKLEALKWYRAAAGLTGAIALDGFDQVIDLAEVERLRNEAAKLEAEKQALEGRLAELGGELARAQGELDQQRADEARLAGELEARERQLAAVIAGDRAEIERLTAQVSDLRRQVTESALQTRVVEAHVVETREALVTSGERTSELDRMAGGFRETIEQFQKLQQEQSEQVRLASGSVAGPTIEVIAPSLLVQDRTLRKFQGQPAPEAKLVGRVTAPAGLETFSVNDESTAVDPSGRFSIALAGLMPAKDVRLAAGDSQGKTSALKIEFPDASPLKQAARKRISAEGFGSYHALIIANHRYESLPDLEMALADARELAGLLESRYGFGTQILENVDRAELLTALYQLDRELSEESNLLIYYSGRSAVDAETREGYWLPPSAGTEPAEDWIPTTIVTDYLSVMRSHHVLVVADSVYPGTATRSAVARIEEATGKDALRQLREIAAKRSRTALVSGGEQPISASNDRKHSVFGEALLAVLWNNGMVLEAQRLFREVAARVTYAAFGASSQPGPSYAPIQFAGHEAGDFLFVPN